MKGNLANFRLEYFADDGVFPNSGLPVVIYRQAVSEPGAEALEALFDQNGWPSQWRAGVYDYDHYHSTAHECLGVAQGSAVLRLGGPKGRDVEVSAGDVVELPAGTAHRCVSRRDGFLMVGSYPPGQDWDLLTGEGGERPGVDQRIAVVPLPVTDPVGGQGGPVLDKWAM